MSDRIKPITAEDTSPNNDRGPGLQDILASMNDIIIEYNSMKAFYQSIMMNLVNFEQRIVELEKHSDSVVDAVEKENEVIIAMIMMLIRRDKSLNKENFVAELKELTDAEPNEQMLNALFGE